jgi:YesN/AraC family two-component response regulator
MLPPEIANSTVNVQAWYMYQHMGMSLEEIGQKLGYSRSGAARIIENAFRRQSRANIYKLQIEYCKNECKDSVSECRKCNLYRFMLNKMVKRR